MKLFFLLVCTLFSQPRNSYKIEFGNTAGRTNDWIILSDNVMGGMSEAVMQHGSKAVMIRGYVSLQNRGGFLSIKSGWGQRDLSAFKMVKIVFRSTLQQYAFTLENSRRWYEPAYKHTFRAGKVNAWETVYLNLEDFTEERIGNPTGNKVDSDILKNIVRIGIATNEKREGPFELEIESIEFL